MVFLSPGCEYCCFSFVDPSYGWKLRMSPNILYLPSINRTHFLQLHITYCRSFRKNGNESILRPKKQLHLLKTAYWREMDGWFHRCFHSHENHPLLIVPNLTRWDQEWKKEKGSLYSGAQMANLITHLVFM